MGKSSFGIDQRLNNQDLLPMAAYRWDASALAWIRVSGGTTTGPDVNVTNFPTSFGAVGAGGTMTVIAAGGSLVAAGFGGSISTFAAGGSLSAQAMGGSLFAFVAGGSLAAANFGGSVSSFAAGGSLSAFVAGGSLSVSFAGVTAIHSTMIDLSVTPIGMSAYTQLVPNASMLLVEGHVWETSAQHFYMAQGASGSEVFIRPFPPGGLGYPYRMTIQPGTRLSVIAVGATMASGYFGYTFMGQL